MEKTYRILKLIILILALVVLILGATKLYNSLTSQMVAPANSAAAEDTAAAPVPDFTVYDLEGNPHKLSDFAGKPVVLNFWASWCGPCKKEMPDFEEKYQHYGEQVTFLMVNLTDGMRETMESATSFVEKQGYSFPVYYDTDLDAAYKYGVNSVPVTYFIDSQGGLVTYQPGVLNADILQRGIDLLLN
jgi:thiol-disulfide isomerase/thioredoxin